MKICRHVDITGNFRGFGSGLALDIPDTAHFSVRVLVDRTIAEFFVSEGRAAVTAPMESSPAKLNAYVSSSTGVMISAATAWDMSCGWSKYP